jgi:glycosyltransferase involved in cell wall biosynthesis
LGIPFDCATLRFPFCWWRLPVNWLRAGRLLRRHRPAAVVTFSSVSNLYAGLLKRRMGISRLLWFQRNAGLDRPPAWLERWPVRRADAFAANAPSGVSFLVETLGVPPEKVALIPNAVRLAPSTSEPGTWRRQFGVSSGVPMACMIANLRPPKDPATLLRAWAAASRRLAVRPHLILAGRFDALAEEVRHLVAAEPLEDCVHLAGCIDDVAGLLRDADFSVFSSRSEGMPNGVLEPMAAGKAVAATDLPGTWACLGPGMEEWLSPPEDAEALAANVVRLAGDSELQRRIGGFNRERAERDFSVGRMADRVVEQLLGSGR